MKAWESMRRNHDALLSHLSKVPLFMEPRLDVVTVRFPAVGGLDAAIWVIWACVPTSTLTKPFLGDYQFAWEKRKWRVYKIKRKWTKWTILECSLENDQDSFSLVCTGGGGLAFDK